MNYVHDRASLARVLRQKVDPRLRTLLLARADILAAGNTEYITVTVSDTEADLIRLINLSPLTEPVTGARFPATDFHPWWDFLQDQGGWFEMIIAFSDFAYVLLIQNADGVWPELLTLCHRYAGGAA